MLAVSLNSKLPPGKLLRMKNLSLSSLCAWKYSGMHRPTKMQCQMLQLKYFISRRYFLFLLVIDKCSNHLIFHDFLSLVAKQNMKKLSF